MRENADRPAAVVSIRTGTAIVRAYHRGRLCEPIPCRHITLNAEGFTIDTYYRYGPHEQLETALAHWLRETIKQLEQERERPSIPLGHS